MDILRGRGPRGLQAFMESLEFYHPEQYTQLTGQQATQRCSMMLGMCVYICVCDDVLDNKSALIYINICRR